MIGTIISHYEILEKLGEGGMGQVYKAHDKRLDRIVALKFLNPDQLSPGVDRAGLLEEAKAAASINHHNVCSIIGIEESDGEEFLVMEFLEGTTLRKSIEAGPMEIRTAVRIALQLAAGLRAAHRKGIIHRDIKPENIIITREQVVKITDFGLARQKERMRDSAIDVVAGTEAYMSPEQIQGQPVDQLTDIWAFGIVLYEMLTGRRPFIQEYREAMLYSITNEKFSPASTVRADIPKSVDVIIDHCLEKMPAVRLQDADALIEELRQAENALLHPGEAALKSIAVLPFGDLSPGNDNQYFSDGLTEEIITRLSKLTNLRVVSHTAVKYYRREEKTTKDIAADLEVQYILQGNVRKQRSNLRITTQLVEAANDTYLWSEQYRGTMEDIFEIQETVAARIAKALRLRLTPGQRKTLKRRSTQNTEAYQLYLKGRFFWNKRDKASLENAIGYFEEAIRKDSGYALAWAGISDSYNLLSEYEGVPRRETYQQARTAVDTALKLDGRLAEARTSLASFLMLSEWDWAGAEKEFKQAVYLNPNYATTHHWYAEWLMFMGRVDESIKEITRASELDPLSAPILKDKGLMFYYSRRYDEAINNARKALELDPRFTSAHRLLSLAYHGNGLMSEAIAENELWGSMTQNRMEETIWLAYLHAASGKKSEARNAIEGLGLDRVSNGNLFRGIALVYSELSDTDLAFQWLEKAYDIRAESLCSLNVDPKADRLRLDSRFTILLQKIGLGA